MSYKFTKGPWRVLAEECGKDYVRIRGTRLGERYKIANVVTPVYAGVHERELTETRANARLIAESPTMFELLEKALPLIAYAYSQSHVDAENIGRDIEDVLKRVNKV